MAYHLGHCEHAQILLCCVSLSGMILSPRDIWHCHNLGITPGTWWAEVRGVVRHALVHSTACLAQQRITWPEMLVVPRQRNLDLVRIETDHYQDIVSYPV